MLFKFTVRRGKSNDIKKFEKVLDLLIHEKKLDEKYRDHKLVGDYEGCRECHIQPDWLLVYYIEDDILMLTLLRTGTHSDLF